MAFDPGNFTLHFIRRPGAPTLLDLRTPPPAHASEAALAAAAASPPLYTFSRARTAAYDVQLVDGLTRAPLAKLQEPSSGEKTRTVRLLNPDQAVLLEKDRNTFSQSYSFSWEGEVYQMRRESSIGSKASGFACDVIRKPDPAMAVALYKPGTKTRPDTLQIFDYNLSRLHFEDKRGLEVALLSVLLTLLDMEYDETHKGEESIYSENYVAPAQTASSSANAPARYEILPVAGSRPPGAQAEASSSSSRPAAASPSSPSAGSRPALHTAPSAPVVESNEIDVTSYGDIAEYVSHCVHLLRADEGGCEMIIIKAGSKDTTPRAVRIAAEVKSAWFRLPPHAKGPPPTGPTLDRDAGTLYQYVRDPALEAIGPKPTAPAARQRISLNEPASSSKPDTARPEYAPPEALSIYLSKSRIDELERRDPALPASASSPWASPPVIPAKVPMSSGSASGAGAGAGASGSSSKPAGLASPPASGAQASFDPKEEPKRGVGKLFGRFGRKGAGGGEAT